MDKYKLEYEMKTRGITIEKLCTELHISRSAFYRKCNGISEFTQGEIQMGIFFADKVSEKTHHAASV